MPPNEPNEPNDPSDRGEPAAWLRAFVEGALRAEAVEEFVRRVGDGILGQLPEIAEDPLLVQDLSGSTRAQWRAFLAILLEPEYRHELPPEAGFLARALARRGMELGVLLKIYRVAHQEVFAFITDVTEEPLQGSPDRREALVFVWRRAGAWIDDSVERLIETFYAERDRIRQGAVARRAAIIDLLLGAHPGAVEEPSTALGHAVHQHQTAFVLWTDEAGSDDVVARLEEAALALGQSLGCSVPLTHLAGRRDLWGWCATPRAPDLAAVGDLGARLDASGLRLAVGTTARGLLGFRSSHVEAMAAYRLAASAIAAPRTVRYDEVELLCLTAGNEEQLRRLVRREVGPLCGAEKNLALVRQTALAFLVHRNVEDAAEELFVHKNTVRYRLSRAEELLGRPLTRRAAQTELALRYVALFGPPADQP